MKCANCGHYRDEHGTRLGLTDDVCLSITITSTAVYDCSCPGYTPTKETPDA